MRPCCGFVALLLSGCESVGLGCTEAGCDDALTITTTATGNLAPGAYTATVRGSDNATASCTFVVADACKGDCVSSTNDCLLGGDIGGIDADSVVLLFPALTSEVTFQLEFGMGVVHEETASVDYETVTPNGKDCPPICMQGSLEIVLP